MKEFKFISQYEEELFLGRYQNPGDKDEYGWTDVFRRVANTVATNVEDQEEYAEMMISGKVIPSSPQLWNYGAIRRFPRNGSSCFTGRMGDTLKQFRQADSDAEDAYVASGGFGLLLNETRPRGTMIRHCSEGAMGSMCFGGPARRVEGTTGYITGSGRARGALMLQLSAWHPDTIEFVLAKRPTSLGWLDDWATNAKSVVESHQDLTEEQRLGVERVIMLFSSKFVLDKDWPRPMAVHDAYGTDDGVIAIMADAGVLKFNGLQGPVIPMVYDWNLASWREANRDWDLPMQNCNVSVRVPDALFEAVDNDDNWVFHWYSADPPKGDEFPWTKTDAYGEGLKDYGDGTVFLVDQSMTDVEITSVTDMDDAHYRYGVVITTWEGLRENLKPNKNQWRDTDYARFYRKIINAAIGNFHGPIKARQVWQLIVENAWNSGDPGLVFEDTYERFQPVDSRVYGPRLSNPCSEYVNSAGGSCNLASLNARLAALEANDLLKMQFGDSWSMSFNTIVNSSAFSSYLKKMNECADVAIRYINDAMEHNVAPVGYIDMMTHDHFRTVGVGVMGLAEALMSFHIPYGSADAERFAATTMGEIALTCWEGSFKLAKDGRKKPLGWNAERMVAIYRERLKNAVKYGCPQSHLDRWNSLIKRTQAGEYATNTCVTSVAPTGTISMIAGWTMTRAIGADTPVTISGGLEPPFDWGIKRTDSAGKDITYHDLWHTDEHRGKPWMITANKLSAVEHVRMQAAVCAFTCMSVSKTINMPNDASIEDVEHAYRLSWKMGIPGTTVYRDRSKPMQVLSALECPSGECGVDYSSLLDSSQTLTFADATAK